MTRTIFHKTATGDYVEVNALVGVAIRIITPEELPPDVEQGNMHVGAYKANRMAKEHNTYCTGETLESQYMRNLNNDFVLPE